MLNVLIIDLRPILRMGIKYLLKKNYKEIELADFDSIQKCLSAATEQKPDFIFLGLDAEMEKVRTLYEVKRNYPQTKLIVYDPEAKKETILKYLKSGAHAYLSKKSDLTKLKTCIETVLSGQLYVDPLDMNTFLAVMLKGNTNRKQFRSRDFSLTPRQQEIALLFAEGMNTSGIARKLGLRPSTVSTVKTRIYAKLNVDNLTELRKMVT